MKFIFDFNDYSLNEELKKLPTTYKYSAKAKDEAHEKLARKEKDGHKWMSAGDKKTDKVDREKKYKCKCGKTKVEKRTGDKMEVTYGD